MSSSTSSESAAVTRTEPNALDFTLAPASDITALIGDTPLIELAPHVTGEHSVLVKHEGLNPGGSIRDRLLCSVVTRALADGTLGPGGELVLPRADNAAVSAALVGHAHGLRTTVFHPRATDLRLVKLLMEAGARVKWSPREDGFEGALAAAAAWAAQPGRLLVDASQPHDLRQALADIGDELEDALDGQPLGAFVTSITSRAVLAQLVSGFVHRFPRALLVGVILDSDPGALDDRILSSTGEIVVVREQEAWDARAWLASATGLLLGPRGASALVGAMRVAPRVQRHDAIVVLSIDGGQRYLGWEPGFADTEDRPRPACPW